MVGQARIGRGIRRLAHLDHRQVPGACAGAQCIHEHGRGAVEVASTYEWGGEGRKGEGTFKEKRPGWDLPIHQLMVKTGVTIFFQGHDHLFARQDLDGIVYQEVPQPSNARKLNIASGR